MTTHTRRLGPGDRAIARALFAMMAETFDEPAEPLGDAYVDALLGRADFWALATLVGDEVVGGLTAHTLPLTRGERAELFIYDVAVHPTWQRRGIGRALFTALRGLAAEAGISVVFVPADEDDAHALAFYRALGGEASPVVMFTFDAQRP